MCSFQAGGGGGGGGGTVWSCHAFFIIIIIIITYGVVKRNHAEPGEKGNESVWMRVAYAENRAL